MYKHFLFLFVLFIDVQTMAQISEKKLPIPLSEKSQQTDLYHGQTIPDPYRWLEDDNSQKTAAWVDIQNAYTQKHLDQVAFKNLIQADLKAMWNYEKFGQPFRKGEYYYFYKNDGLQNQSVLYRQFGLEGDPMIFIDPNSFNKYGTSSLGSLSFSKNHKYCAYAVSNAGSDWQDIYIMDVATQETIQDTILYTKFSNVAWVGDEGFYYSGYDMPANQETKYSAATEFQKIFYHQLGTDQRADQLVYEDKLHPKRYKGVQVTEDERWIILSQSEGTDGTQIDIASLVNNKLITNQNFTTLLPGFSYNYDVIETIEDKFLVYTNHGADNYRVVLIDPKKPKPSEWKEIIKESKSKLDGVSFVGGQLICSYLENAVSSVYHYDLKGNLVRQIDLPGLGTASGFGGEKEDKTTFYTFSSFNYPSTIYSYDLATGKSTLFKKPTLGFSMDNVLVEQMFFTSTDGTKVPMFVVHRKDVLLDGSASHPTYLYGYGGFNISLTPSFSVLNSYFVQQGGIYVMVNLRGGSEYGEAWHKAGMLENKQQVFDDFIGAAQFLIDKKITSSEKIAISGRSNGGLLVGACMTQRPDLFKVALPGVGVLDMLRYHKFTVGWGWVVEYGSSDVEKDFSYLIKYSPLHNLKKGTNYPATMITTADHDDRVVPAHSFKFAAALQEMNSGKNPCLIRIDKQAGHGAGKPTSKVIEEWTDIYAFTMHHLGMTAKKIMK